MARPGIARAAVSIDFAPSQPFGDALTRWLTEFCELTLQDREMLSRLRMAVNELVENVVKYGSTPSVRVEVELEASATGSILRLKTRNRTSPERLRQAVRLLSELRDAPDPIAYYDRLIVESAPRTDTSGIGLVRIRAEGNLDVDFEVSGAELCVIVATSLHRKECQ